MTIPAYYKNHPRPPSCTYSEDAEILYKNVTGNMHVVEKALPGEAECTNRQGRERKAAILSYATPAPTR
jgi:hypothetical protein